MTKAEFIASITAPQGGERTPGSGTGLRVTAYPRSVQQVHGALLFIGREGGRKCLYAVDSAGRVPAHLELVGMPLPPGALGEGQAGLRCPLMHANAERIRALLPFTRPVPLGLANSFGFGDRLGTANPAHVRALNGFPMRPVLAQQSIRELERTQRTAEEVLDAATWAVLQEGYTGGFGADADHLKTPEDIDRMARAGFTMYTFDPSAHVVNEAATLPLDDVRARCAAVETGELRLADAIGRYAGVSINLGKGAMLEPSCEEIERAFLKYSRVVQHATEMYRHLKSAHAGLVTEAELSVDETDLPTTPAEHIFIAGELERLGVKLISLAPRFVGDFEKGVDYRGDLTEFAREYRQHARIAATLGPYKLSIHSGSDKFTVYDIISSITECNVHVKTAGTSYLEALRTVAMVEPRLFCEIFAFARGLYEEERRSYHVSARLDRLPALEECSPERLPALFEEHDARQVLHVTFGRVLTAWTADGRPLFRDRITTCLDAHEDLHYENLVRHFRRHLTPFARHEHGGAQ